MSSTYNRKDHLYKKAKEEGHRSRATYKLEEIQQRFELIRKGMRVLDLGAWPGGWSELALRYVGESGRVFGIDLQTLDPIEDPRFQALTGDARDDSSIVAAKEWAGGSYDVILSDMSPKLTGIKEADQGGIVACAELAMWVGQQLLKSNGALVVKVFKGSDVEGFVKSIRPMFNKVTRAELKSTRNTSNEFYIIAQGYKGSSTHA